MSHGDDQECIFGFWEGYGMFPQGASLSVPSFESTPGHNYLLFNTTLSTLRDQWLTVLNEAQGKETNFTPNAI